MFLLFMCQSCLHAGFTEQQVLSAKFLATSSASALQARLQGAFDFLKTLEQDDNTLVGLEPLARVLAGTKCLQHKNQVSAEAGAQVLRAGRTAASSPLYHEGGALGLCVPHRMYAY